MTEEHQRRSSKGGYSAKTGASGWITGRSCARLVGMNLRKTSVWFHLLDVLLNIVIIVAIVAMIRTFLVSPFEVEGSSMVDTLEDREYIIINKLAYHIGKPDRGDVVVFRPPNNPSKHYVKRVIGIPEDTISLRDGKVYLQPAGSDEEFELFEPYLNATNQGRTYQQPPSGGNTDEIRYFVPEGHYFLMGDNRQGSLDSRSFSPSPYVDEDAIKGKVWFVALPIDKIHALAPPAYDL
ncbi:signal peptidase I [Candidatus Peregrinibacteria bacterium CG10_big_fil_rev_8_21_14_0_10_55_24]|nr:MAG: signal peptidase I [Candidatus Peregrinibacteria bacterium CG10_big_fil_rev_8_21_14_0_10_55_24]